MGRQKLSAPETATDDETVGVRVPRPRLRPQEDPRHGLQPELWIDVRLASASRQLRGGGRSHLFRLSGKRIKFVIFLDVFFLGRSYLARTR